MTETLRQLVAEKHLRRKAVEEATGLSTSSIYRLMNEKLFPRPVRVGKRAVAWPESVITNWLASRPTAAA